METNTTIPGINIQGLQTNPIITSPYSPFQISFKQTRESLMDPESYRNFLKSAVTRFRHSRTYTHYKAYLYGLGLDKCQFEGNLTSEMCSIEMHHMIITVYDVAIIICEHILNTKGEITSFDLVQLLKEVHKENKVGLVMLSLTAHQLFHNTDEFFIHPDMVFGKWYEFLQEYYTGITRDIAFKILFYINTALSEGRSNDHGLLDVRQQILDWSKLNGNLK